jgi:hypothetical protein
MWPRVWLVFTCLALGGVAPASAAWTQSDLRGRWDVYAAGAAGAFWTRCVIRVRANGVIVSGTRCFYDTGDQTVVDSGRLNLARTCRAAGHLTERAGSQLGRFRDKDLLVGVGESETGSVFLFNAIRR